MTDCRPGSLKKGNRELKAKVHGQVIFSSATQILDTPLAGFGLAYLPAGMAEPHVARNWLQRVLEDSSPPFPGYYLYYPSRRQSSPAFALLVDALRYSSWVEFD